MGSTPSKNLTRLDRWHGGPHVIYSSPSCTGLNPLPTLALESLIRCLGSKGLQIHELVTKQQYQNDLLKDICPLPTKREFNPLLEA